MVETFEGRNQKQEIHKNWSYFFSIAFVLPHTQGRIKLFGAPRQWKHFRPLFQAVFLSGGRGITPPDWVKHHASQSQDKNNNFFILYIEFCINNKI